MITVQILEPNDILQGDDWCRPVYLTENLVEKIEVKCTYSGTAINNLKWVRVKAVIGKVWLGRPLLHFSTAYSKVTPNEHKVHYEFIRGTIPLEHQLEMDGKYADLSVDIAKFEAAEAADQQDADDIAF